MIPILLIVFASVLPQPPSVTVTEHLPDDDADTFVEYREGVFLTALEDVNGPYRAPPPPPQPKAAAPAPRRSYGSGVEQWRSLVASVFPANQVDKALRVMKCESRGDPNAQNRRSSAAGLFQILRKTWGWVTSEPWSSRYDPAANVRTAFLVWKRQGWGGWSCG